MKERKSKRKLQSYKDEKERNEVIILQRREGNKEIGKEITNLRSTQSPVCCLRFAGKPAGLFQMKLLL